jgi:AraC-like DNA-binding protein
MRSILSLTEPSPLVAFPGVGAGPILVDALLRTPRGGTLFDAGGPLEDVVLRAIEHMSADLTERHSLETISEATRCGPFALIRAFRRLTGTTPMRFLTILRLAEAKRILLMSDAQVIQACYDVGYESLGSFNNRFKALVGLTPTELRRKARLLDVQCQALSRGEAQRGFIYAAAVYRSGAAHADLVDLHHLQGTRGRPPERDDCVVIYYAVPCGASALELLLQRSVLRSECVPLTDDWQSLSRLTSIALRPPTQFDPPVLPVIADCLNRWRALPPLRAVS